MSEEQLSREFLMNEIIQLQQKNRTLESQNEEFIKMLLLAVNSNPEIYSSVINFLGTLSDTFFIVDGDWNLVYFNPRVNRKNDCHSEHFIGKKLWDLLPEPLNPMDYQNLMRAMNERIRLEYETYAGSLQIWFEVSLHPAGNGGLFCYYKDINQRKQAEQQILCQNAVLQGINRIFKQALFSGSKRELGRFCLEVAEEVTGSHYGFITELNGNGQMYSIAIGRSAEEHCKIEPELRESVYTLGLAVKGIYGPVLRDGIRLFTNDPVSHPDSVGLPAGHPPLASFMGVPLRSKGKTIGMLGLANRPGGYTDELMQMLEPLAHAIVQVLDRQKDYEALKSLQAKGDLYRALTEKLLKANLAQSEDRFYKAFHYNPHMMVIINMKDNSFIEVNQAALDTFGFSRDEVLGNNLFSFGTSENYDEIQQIIRALKAHGKVSDIEINTRTKSGNNIVIAVSSILITFYEEECRLSIMKDITDRKYYEKELARLDRLHLIGEMAASLGHEVRNPITSVRGFLQMFSQQEEHGEKKLYYELMIEELDRANAIISEFLSMARDKTSNLQPLYLNSIIETLHPMMQAEALQNGKEIELLLENAPPLLLDKNEIRQMILNMVRNGLEAMCQNGTVTISTAVRPKEILLSIKDQGRGIDPEYLDRIGTPFVSSKENGTGLGLAVCYSIAARHGAKIDYNTGPDGTTFMVRFPMVPEEK